MLVTKLGFYKDFPTHLFLIFTSRLLAGPVWDSGRSTWLWQCFFSLFACFLFDIFMAKREGPFGFFQIFFYFLFSISVILELSLFLSLSPSPPVCQFFFLSFVQTSVIFVKNSALRWPPSVSLDIPLCRGLPILCITLNAQHELRELYIS